MNSIRNSDIFRQYIEMWNTGNTSLADTIISPTYKDHAHPEITDLSALKEAVQRVRASNPELHFEIEKTIEEGEFLAIVRKTLYGARVVDNGMWLARICNGQLAELWTFYNKPASTEKEG
jgi:predicted SnoaL-like aldol condensation-catalyzing enzyme